MENNQGNRIRAVEPKEAVERYESLKRIGEGIFPDSHVAKTGKVDRTDVELAKKYLKEAITATDPETRATYFEHLMIAPELGRRIAEKVIGVNPDEIEFLLWFHDLGRLASPGAFYRNDLITERLLYEFGVREDLRKKLPSLRDVEEEAEDMDMTKEQIKGKQPLVENQEKQAENFFNSLTPTQIIITLADNLGKRDNQGGLFNLESFYQYLKGYEALSKQDDNKNQGWPSVKAMVKHRPEAARLQALVVDKATDWLKEKGVDINEVLAGLTDYGPRFVVLLRHGEVHNPNNLTYTRDSLMKEEDKVHLSNHGKEQLNQIGEKLLKRLFRIVKIYSSPSVRAVESAEALTDNEIPVETNIDLDDGACSGPYKKGIPRDVWMKTGNVFDFKTWSDHEHPEEITSRVRKAFDSMLQSLAVGQVVVLLSHETPLEKLMISLTNSKPSSISYGQGRCIILDKDGKIFSYYKIT